MRTLQIISIILQVLSVCTLSFALGYSKLKLPKRMLFLNIFVLYLVYMVVSYYRKDKLR